MQHSQIFSLFFRNQIQCIALYQLHNSQALLNLCRGYFNNIESIANSVVIISVIHVPVFTSNIISVTPVFTKDDRMEKSNQTNQYTLLPFKDTIFLLTGLRIYTGEYKAQGPMLCPTEGRALRGPRALYSPV